MRRPHPRIATVARGLMLVSALALLAVPNDSRAATTPTAAVGGTAGATATIGGWQIRDSAQVSDSGVAISSPTYAATGWLSAAPRSTVMAGLVQNGKYPDIFTSTNMRKVDAGQFKRDWWYRATFTVNGGTGLHTVLRLGGVIPRADVWLDGKQIATKTQVVGAHNATDIDITGTVKQGTNALALRVTPADPKKDLITGWIDWNPWPPDNNMGIWQDATLHQSGPVALSGARVTTALALPAMSSADVTVKADVHNNTGAAMTATVAGTIGGIALNAQQVSLAANETKTVTVKTTIANPKVWWPRPLGDHPTYEAALTATAGGGTSDTAATTFGIRDVKSSLDSSGHRVFTVNGKPLLIRSGGWASDIFLRTDLGRLRKQFDVVADLGLNSIRLEGKLETDEFYDLADQYGILLLPGWECCDKWQSLSSWSDADYQVAFASMSATAQRIRNHPSVLGYLVGSDEAPNARAETGYLNALKAAEWPNPIITAAADRSSPKLGKSGMKMDGPYDYVPPNYWYGSQLGAAFGFASELSAGPNVPNLDSVKAMLSSSEQEQLWKSNGNQYHAGLGQFSNLKLYNTAIQNRYGKPSSLEDYVRKAQLTNYENIRAQFEAYAARMDRGSNPSTGLVYWMLNNGWPSLIWHLYDWYLAPDAGAFAAKKANQSVHVLWQYDSGAVNLVNHTGAAVSNLSVTAETYSLDGTKRFGKTVTGQSVGSLRTAQPLTVPTPTGFTGAYLVKLVLKDGSGKEVDRNVYWWSTKGDVLNWGGSDWYYTPVSSYADLGGLTRMSPATVSAKASTTVSGSTATTTVTLTNTGSGPVPAFFVEATLRDAKGARVAPVSWSDNAVSLWPGESLTLTATSQTGNEPLTVEVAGINVARKTAAR